MLSTELALILALTACFLSVILGIASAINARRARSYAAECQEWVSKTSKLRDPTVPVAELSAELTELADSYHALLKSHKKLRSRIQMRENRQKGGAETAGDLSSQNDKRELRLEAKRQGLLK